VITRSKGKIVFTCDHCDFELETNEHEFREAILVLKERQWKSRKMGEEWLHFCTGCQR
jgi:hypothetical protein